MRRSAILTVGLVVLATVAACTEGSAETATTAPATSMATTTLPSTTAASTTTTTVAATATVPPGTWLGATTPEAQGMSSNALADLVEHIDLRSPDIDGITVVRNGAVVLDAAFSPHERDTPHQVYSVTKSIVSTLIGVAIGDGLIGGVDLPVVEVLADHAPAEIDDRKAAMTIEDVLTMSTGLDCRDSYLYRWEGLGEMRASDDWAAHVLALPMRDEPGTRFEYCNGASHLLATMLTEATGLPALEYARNVLFEPLGIEDVTWREGPEGQHTGYAGIAMQTVDMAKIGWLYLQDGRWGDVQILPAGWAGTATKHHIDAGTAAAGYGYQWWTERGVHLAIGYGGQYILLVPELDLVATFVSGLSSNSGAPAALLTRYIVPAITSDEPLPDDPEAAARLDDAIAAASQPPTPRPTTISPLAVELDGIPHVLDENSGGFEWFVLDHDEDTLTMSIEDVDGRIDVRMRFDGRFHVNDAWGTQWAFRPEWTSDSTLEIDFRLVGDAGRGVFTFTIMDDRVDFSYRELVFGTSVSAEAERLPPTIVVPEAPAPVIDGSIDGGEWDEAFATTMDDGSVVRWLHDGVDLYVAVESDRSGARNLAIAEGDRTRILHASAALGSAEYQLIDGSWRLRRDFSWCCRGGVDGAEAAKLEQTERWVATLPRDGPGEQVEVRVEWPAEGAAVALSHVPASGDAAFWPVWLGEDGKAALTGERQAAEDFSVERWILLEQG